MQTLRRYKMENPEPEGRQLCSRTSCVRLSAKFERKLDVYVWDNIAPKW